MKLVGLAAGLRRNQVAGFSRNTYATVVPASILLRLDTAHGRNNRNRVNKKTKI